MKLGGGRVHSPVPDSLPERGEWLFPFPLLFRMSVRF
jgi:hypothetical protein